MHATNNESSAPYKNIVTLYAETDVNAEAIAHPESWEVTTLKEFHTLAVNLEASGRIEILLGHRESQTGYNFYDLVEFKKLK